MKRLVLFSFVLLALVLFVTSCFKPPFVVITLSSDAQSKNVIEGTEITFFWTFETADEFSEVKYTLNINDVGIELTATDYATTLSKGSYEVWVDGFGKLTTESSFRDFHSNKLEFTVGSASVVFNNSETAYSTDTVLVSWEPTDGLEHSYLYSVDGAEYVETDQKSVELTELGDGIHSVEVKTFEFNGIPSKYLFEVDTVGPSITIFGSDRYSGFLGDGDFRPFGRYMYTAWQFSEPAVKVELRFRETTEEGYPWITDWLDWDPEVGGILLNDELVTLYLTDGTVMMPYMLELGHTYLLYVKAYDELGNTNNTYVTFKLEDRYNGEEKPEIFILPISAQPATDEEDGLLLVAVQAQNVKEYIEKAKEYFAPDNTENGELMYLQNSLFYSEELEVSEVVFPVFIPEKKNVSSFADFDDESVLDKLVLLRGFVNEPSEIEESSDIIAFIEFSFGPEMNGQEISLGLGDYFIRDNANRTIDGIVVDNFIYSFDLPEIVGADM